jgi:hypothetical protein
VFALLTSPGIGLSILLDVVYLFLLHFTLPTRGVAPCHNPPVPEIVDVMFLPFFGVEIGPSLFMYRF